MQLEMHNKKYRNLYFKPPATMNPLRAICGYFTLLAGKFNFFTGCYYLTQKLMRGIYHM